MHEDNQFMVDYQFKPLHEVACFIGSHGRHVNWYALSDSFFSIRLKNTRLLEYSDAFAAQHGCGKINDYYLQQLVGDLCAILPAIGESIPEELYRSYQTDHKRLLTEAHGNDDRLLGDPAFNYLLWLETRMLDTRQLFGPDVYFYRCGDSLLILWYPEDYENRWAAQNGSVEISYSGFLVTLRQFFDSYLVQMAQRSELALVYDWRDVGIDRLELAESQGRCREMMAEALERADSERIEEPITDWKLLQSLHRQIITSVR